MAERAYVAVEPRQAVCVAEVGRREEKRKPEREGAVRYVCGEKVQEGETWQNVR